MNISIFNISVREVEEVLKDFQLFQMKGIKSLNEDGVSDQFKKSTQKDNYWQIYRIGLENFDYDFLLVDQSYFQFQFSQTQEGMAIRYAFFQNPLNFVTYEDFLNDFGIAEEEAKEVDLRAEYEQYLNEQSLSNQYTTLRYDYDEIGYRPLIHAVSHLHIGFNNNVRIPLNKVISPIRFLLFVLKHVYLNEWSELCKSDYIRTKLTQCRSNDQLLEVVKWQEVERLDMHLN